MKRYLAFGLCIASMATFSILMAAAQDADSPFDVLQDSENAIPIAAPVAPSIPPALPGEPRAVAVSGALVRHPWGEDRSAEPEAVELMKQDGELGAQVAELAARVKDLTDSDERADAEKRLAELVAKQFVVRQSLRERELTQLEAQVARLRDLHRQRTEQKDRIIADRVQQLLREAEGLGWGDASAVHGGGTLEFRTGARRWRLPQDSLFDFNQRRVIMSEDAMEAAAEAAAAAAVDETVPADEDE